MGAGIHTIVCYNKTIHIVYNLLRTRNSFGRMTENLSEFYVNSFGGNFNKKKFFLLFYSLFYINNNTPPKIYVFLIFYISLCTPHARA